MMGVLLLALVAEGTVIPAGRCPGLDPGILLTEAEYVAGTERIVRLDTCQVERDAARVRAASIGAAATALTTSLSESLAAAEAEAADAQKNSQRWRQAFWWGAGGAAVLGFVGGLFCAR